MEYLTLVLVFFALVFDRLNIFLYLIVSSVLHELGHIAACILFKIKPHIVISPFGFKLRRYTNNKKEKLIILISGPIVNLGLVLISAVLLHNKYSLNKHIFFIVNIIIFSFNMLPISFLDGGQVLACFCQNTDLRKVLDIVSFVFIAVIVIIYSNNILVSLSAVTFFLVYYFINTIDK